MQLETQTQLPAQNPPPNLPEELTPLNIIRTETVLSKLPVHNLSKKGRVDIQITKLGPHGEVELKWEVSYSERYGQARQLAYKLDTIVVNQRIQESGRPLPERICLGSLNQIAEELGLMADHGTTNKHLKKALRQNALAGITAKFRYKGNDGSERTLEATFTRYSVIFTGEKLSNGTRADAVYIELNTTYRDVLNNAPVRPLDLDYKKALPPAAQRFYEIVSYKIFTALKYNHPAARLAYSEYCTFSAQQRYFTREQVQKQMYKIHVIHQRSGYLAKVDYEPTTDEQGNPDWLMCYLPGPKARAEYARFTGKKLPRTIDAASQIGAGERVHQRRPRQKSFVLLPSVDADLLTALTGRGVSETAARKLLTELPAGYPTLDTLEWGDTQVSTSRGKITNPPGFYISLLRDRTTPPPTFESSQVRKARQEADLRKQQALQEEEARRLAEEEAEEQRLDQFQAAEPQAYQALYDRAKTELYSQFPNLARYSQGREDSAMHDGAIRARIKIALRNARSQAAAAFAASLKATLSTPQLSAPKLSPAMPETDPL